jgi:membrane protease subunit HflC
VSEAERDANIIRGEADAERNAILAEAFGQDQEFFAFLRSMEAYRNSLTGENATLMVEPDSAFFHYLRSPDGRPPAGAPPEGREGPAESTAAGLDD